LTSVETVGNSCRTTTTKASFGSIFFDAFENLVYTFTPILTYRHG
jgi:hypothetical protein